MLLQAARYTRHPLELAQRSACSRAVTAAGARRPSRRIVRASADGSSRNPLELLRSTKDVVERAKLMQQLDASWSEAAERYNPTATETFLSQELGVWQYNVMMAALQDPSLLDYDLEIQIKPAVKSMKAAGLQAQDIWFLTTKRPQLLFQHPVSLQRYLDFVAVYQDVGSRDLLGFLLRSPPQLLTDRTLYEAGAVVAFLRTIGVRPEHLAKRVFCLRPEVLLRDVERELRPIVAFLMSLGMEVADVAKLVCAWPEVLLSDVGDQLQPFRRYLLDVCGCSVDQLRDIVFQFPQLLHAEPAKVFAPRIAALQVLGLTAEEVKRAVSNNAAFLTVKGGVDDQIRYLTGTLGLSSAQLRRMLLQHSQILAQQVLQLEKKVAFLTETVGVNAREEVSRCPILLAACLMQCTGPRHAFVTERNLTAAVRHATGGLDWERLLAGEDSEFCEILGASSNEYEGFRTAYEQSYTEQMHSDSVKEFQDELRKLGIYEGE